VRTIVVVAGTEEEAREYLSPWPRGVRHAIVATSARQLEGLVLAQGAVVYVGTWLERPDLPEVVEALEVAHRWWEFRLRKMGGE